MAHWRSVAVVLVLVVTSATWQVTFTNSAYLDAAEKYLLQWRYDADTITFGVQVATLGYVGFGISPTGDMTGSDIVTGFVTNQGDTYFYDRYATARALPAIDASQDWTLEASLENGTHTFLQFSRKLVLCDDTDRTIKAGTTRVIWSYHQEDPPHDTALMYHGETRGARSLMLLSADVKKKKMKEAVQTMEILNNAYTVPDDRVTTYLCRGFKVPDFGGKRHIIGYEQVVQAGNEGLIHHLDLYTCRVEPADPDQYDGVQEPRGSTFPNAWGSCRIFLLVTHTSEKGVYYPDNVGMPIGGPGDPTFLMMETHYNNAQMKKGIVDSSGLRIFYTAELREHDLGRLEVSAEVPYKHIIIPPRSPAFVTTHVCYPDCLEKAMEEQSIQKINVFNVLMHAHLAGRKLRIRHVRNGVELPWLANDDNYDFYYQHTIQLDKEVEVLKGDYLIMECTYDTSDRSTITYSGTGTQSEMCTSWLMHYPRMKLSWCKSSPHPAAYLAALGATEVTFNKAKNHFVPVRPPYMAGYTLFQFLKTINWNDELRQEFQDLQTTADRQLYCLNGDDPGTTIKQSRFAIREPPPVIHHPYEEPNNCHVQATVEETRGAKMQSVLDGGLGKYTDDMAQVDSLSEERRRPTDTKRN